MTVGAGELFSESGGLLWHAKALMRHRTIWADFRDRIDRFLTDWLADIALYPGKPVSGVILVGPSGGWCLPQSGFLDHFTHVIAIDPDAAAKKVFLTRHKPTPVSSTGLEQHQTWIPSTFQNVLPALLNRFPDHAVLFCNVLGQLRYQENKTLERIEFELNQIKIAKEGRHWASFHDRISGVGRLSEARVPLATSQPPTRLSASRTTAVLPSNAGISSATPPKAMRCESFPSGVITTSSFLLVMTAT